MNSSRMRLSLLLVLGAATAVLAACAGPAAPPQPPAPTVALAPRIVEEASAYRGYMHRAAAISPVFVDGPSVASSLQVSAAYDPAQLVRGAIAYGAVIALQDPAFVAGVRAFASDAATRNKVIYEIYKDPAYVVAIAGSDSAAGRIVEALGDDGQKVFAAGQSVKQSAYDVQRANWSKADVVGRDLRLSQAKTLSATPIVGDVAETLSLQQAITTLTPAGPVASTPKAPPYTNLVVRSLAVAALGALGASDDNSVDNIKLLMVDTVGGTCLKLAKLNLYQCLAVSKPHYEDIFCIGQHAMMDTGRCVIAAAGAPTPINIVPQPLEVAQTTAAAKPVAAAKVKPKKKR